MSKHRYLSLFDKPAEVRQVTLRDYQQQACEAVFQEWRNGHRSTLIEMPTGTGKTVVFSEIVRRQSLHGSRILVVAHRAELIQQAAAQAHRLGLKAGIEMAASKAGDADVVVSSVQTLTSVSFCRACYGEGCEVCGHIGKVRRMTTFNPADFSLVVIDEAHHATARTYRMVLHWFFKNPDCRALLVTATPKRGDGVGLHNVADSVAYRMTLTEAIDRGYLCNVLQRFVYVQSLDLSRVCVKAGGDFADGELERVMLGGTDEDEQVMLHSVARPTIEQAAGKQGLVFCAGIDHARKMTAALNAYPGVSAECVVDKTPTHERRQIVGRYKAGQTQFLVGCGVFTEGFDAPETQVVSIARPTKSIALYMQMIGRVTRPLPGLIDGLPTPEQRLEVIRNSAKPVGVVLDFVGNAGRHKVVSLFDALGGGNISPEDLDAAIAEARRALRPVDVREVAERAKQARLEREQRQREERRKQFVATHYAKSVAYCTEDRAVGDIGRDGLDEILRSYKPKPFQPTENQIKILHALGVGFDRAVKYSRSQAWSVITKLQNKRHGGDYIMPFGKHVGKPLRLVPMEYLLWVQQNVANRRLLREIQTMRKGR